MILSIVGEQVIFPLMYRCRGLFFPNFKTIRQLCFVNHSKGILTWEMLGAKTILKTTINNQSEKSYEVQIYVLPNGFVYVPCRTFFCAGTNNHSR